MRGNPTHKDPSFLSKHATNHGMVQSTSNPGRAQNDSCPDVVQNTAYPSATPNEIEQIERAQKFQRHKQPARQHKDLWMTHTSTAVSLHPGFHMRDAGVHAEAVRLPHRPVHIAPLSGRAGARAHQRVRDNVPALRRQQRISLP